MLSVAVAGGSDEPVEGSVEVRSGADGMRLSAALEGGKVTFPLSAALEGGKVTFPLSAALEGGKVTFPLSGSLPPGTHRLIVSCPGSDRLLPGQATVR